LESVSALMRYVVGSGYGSMLDNIVDRFRPMTGLMQTEEILRDVGVSYVRARKEDGVAYAEGRFAPQYHTREGLSLKDVIASMADGLAEGSEKYEVKTTLIVAIGREASPRLGVEVAKAAANSGEAAALDLGGPEAGNPPHKFMDAFKIARDSGLRATVHAGEGAESLERNQRNMEEAITLLGAHRLGHAVSLVNSERLLELVLGKSISIEMNPVSNLVLHNIEDLRELGIDRLLSRGVLVSVNSDDPALWPRGSLSDVYFRTCQAFRFGFEELDRLVLNSFDSSFAERKVKAGLTESYMDARRQRAS